RTWSGFGRNSCLKQQTYGKRTVRFPTAPEALAPGADRSVATDSHRRLHRRRRLGSVAERSLALAVVGDAALLGHRLRSTALVASAAAAGMGARSAVDAALDAA